MKHLIFALLILVGCSEESDPSFTSLAGDWKMSGDITGTFTIAETGGDLVVDHGHYTYDGVDYEITVKRAIEENQNFQVSIYLISNQDDGCVLRYCDYDLVSFKTISPSRIDFYTQGGVESYYNVTVTR